MYPQCPCFGNCCSRKVRPGTKLKWMGAFWGFTKSTAEFLARMSFPPLERTVVWKCTPGSYGFFFLSSFQGWKTTKERQSSRSQQNVRSSQESSVITLLPFSWLRFSKRLSISGCHTNSAKFESLVVIWKTCANHVCTPLFPLTFSTTTTTH